VEFRGIDDYENYLINRNWALRAEAIEGSLVGNKLVDGFRQLYEETFNKEHFKPTAQYLSARSAILGDYLVSLALTGGDERVEKIRELLKKHMWVLNAVERFSVLTKLTLNALLDPKDRLGDELGGRIVVAPRELIKAFKDEISNEFLPALRVTFGLVKPEDVSGECESMEDLTKKRNCMDAVLAAKGDGAAVMRLREVDLLKGLGLDAESLNDEYKRLVGRLDGKSLVQLLAPRSSRAWLALMLHALINGDEKLAKAHALSGAVDFSDKLLIRLCLDVYRACEQGCDLGNEDLRQAVTKLFLYHI